MTPEDPMAAALTELVDSSGNDFDLMEILAVLTDRCAELIHVSGAGLMLSQPSGELAVVASSGPGMRLLELLEQQAEEGPCPDCYRTGEPVLNCRLAGSEQRWPRFAPRAIELGYRTVHALPMHVRGHVIGALNLFFVEDGDLEESEVRAGQALADVAAIAIIQNSALADAHLLNQQLNHALSSRIAIEQAKGVVAARTEVGMDDAFATMRKYARSNNLKLREVAEELIAGTLPAQDLKP